MILMQKILKYTKQCVNEHDIFIMSTGSNMWKVDTCMQSVTYVISDVARAFRMEGKMALFIESTLHGNTWSNVNWTQPLKISQ